MSRSSLSCLSWILETRNFPRTVTLPYVENSSMDYSLWMKIAAQSGPDTGVIHTNPCEGDTSIHCVLIQLCGEFVHEFYIADGVMSCRKLPITWSFMDSSPKKCCLSLLNLIPCIRYIKWYLQHVPKSILLKYLSASGSFTKASLWVFCWCVAHYHVPTSLLLHSFCSLKVQAEHSWSFFSRSHWAEVKALAVVVISPGAGINLQAH